MFRIRFLTLASVGVGLHVMVLIACTSLPDGKPNLGALNTPTVSGDPCRNADWFEIGRVDGLNGIPLNSSAYVNRCLSQGVPIDNELYTAGWQRGLVDYCVPERAFDAGRAGETYHGVCPKNIEDGFLKRFHVGTRIAEIEKKNILLETEVDRKLTELAAIDALVNAPAAKPSSSILNDAISRAPSSTTTARQATIQAELKELRDQLARNGHAIRELENTTDL